MTPTTARITRHVKYHGTTLAVYWALLSFMVVMFDEVSLTVIRERWNNKGYGVLRNKGLDYKGIMKVVIRRRGRNSMLLSDVIFIL